MQSACLSSRPILGPGEIRPAVDVAQRSHLPDSLRWLMLHGRYDDTRNVDTTTNEENSDPESQRGAQSQVTSPRGRMSAPRFPFASGA
jgi:hypothetical protein